MLNEKLKEKRYEKFLRNMDNFKKLKKGFEEIEKLRQVEQNFNYAGQEYLDAAIFEMNAVNEKFRAMLREKRREMSGERAQE